MMTEGSNMVCYIPKLFVIITDKEKCEKLDKVLRSNNILLDYVFPAVGSANSEILNMLGLDGSEKIVSCCLQPGFKVHQTMSDLAQKLEFYKKGNGIAFSIPLSGISNSITHIYHEEIQQFKERVNEQVDTALENVKEEFTHSLILAVINHGFSDTLMEAARKGGARGGTIINARRMGIDESVKFFGISLQTEKEIVAILTERSHKLEIMQEISKACGVKTEAHGVFMSLPVSNVTGLAGIENQPEE